MEKTTYMQIHGTDMDTKMAVAIANIFIAKVETEILNQGTLKPLVWRRFNDIFYLWDTTRKEITQFSFTNTIKLSSLRLKYPKQKQTSWTLLFTKLKDLKPSRRPPTETFQYTHFSSCLPSEVKKKGFIRGEALRLLRTKHYLRRASQTSKHTFLLEDTRRT